MVKIFLVYWHLVDPLCMELVSCGGNMFESQLTQSKNTIVLKN